MNLKSIKENHNSEMLVECNRTGFRVHYQWNRDSGFLELNSVFQRAGFWIPQAKISWILETKLPAIGLNTYNYRQKCWEGCFFTFFFLSPPAPGPMLSKTLMFVRVIVLLHPNIR